MRPWKSITKKWPGILSDPLFVAGVDLGQARDPTAEAVIELAASALHLRHLQRLPLGMPYPEVAMRIGATMQALPGASVLKFLWTSY